MNKKIGISAVVIIGICIGIIWSYQTNTKDSMDNKGHQMSSKIDKKMMGKMELPDSLKQQLDNTILTYFDIQKALSTDDLDQAKKSSKQIMATLITDGNTLSGHAKTLWEKETQTLAHTLKAIQSATTLSEARHSFEKLSVSIERLVIHFGGPKGQRIAKYRCPMVDNNRGANWLQNSEGTQNPYYGSQMFSCGSMIKEL
ncbi:DUF3347 domain-containing protein [bacterium]|nr:DUF3347 domain-containing protein [bacterium]